MSINVAIVEDNLAFLSAFMAHIAESPDLSIVGVATDYASGLNLLNGRAPDVLLVDLGLPDGNGLDLIAKANQRWQSCDVMVVSVFGNQQNVLAALAAGATGYILKDDEALNFAEHIKSLKAGGSPISPAIARHLLNHLNAPMHQANKSTHLNAFSSEEESQALLSPQEQNVLNLAAKGYNYDEVAGMMGLTRHTVATYVKRCYRKLQVNSKTEAIYEARKHGLVKD